MGKEMFRNLIVKANQLPAATSADQASPGKTRPSSYVVCDVSERNVVDFLGIMKHLGVSSGNGEGMIRVVKGERRGEASRCGGLTCVISITTDPAELALASSTIVSMIPTSNHVRSVYTSSSPSSVLSALKSAALTQQQIKETLCMDESTIDMAGAKEVCEKIEETGASSIDAPVSGGETPCHPEFIASR